MKQIVRFRNMTVSIPLKDGETPEDAEDRLLDILDDAGFIFAAYNLETDEAEDDETE